MIEILRHGSKWPLESLDEDKRQADVAEALAFGNHKGALLQPELLKKLVSKDVQHGYCLPLPLAKATKIPSILIAPMNIQKQNTIDEHGQIVPKDRVTGKEAKMNRSLMMSAEQLGLSAQDVADIAAYLATYK